MPAPEKARDARESAADACATNDCDAVGRNAVGRNAVGRDVSGCGVANEDAGCGGAVEVNAGGCETSEVNASGCGVAGRDADGRDGGGCGGGEADVGGLSHARHMAWRALLQGHAALVERIGREVSAAGGVSLDSYDVMRALSSAPGGRLKMGELACHVVLSRSGLTRLVDRMEASGWVARELAAGDRRSFEAFLTSDGEAAFKATWPLYARAIARVLAPLSDADAQQLADWLDRVRLNGA